jgi:16S rRNA processing protein RimM
MAGFMYYIGFLYTERNCMEDLLQVGAITQPHGVHGEVKVFPTTDDVKRFKKLKEVILDTGKEKKTLEIEQVKFFKQFVILKFKGYDTINDVEIYKRRNLYVTRENAVKCAKDEYFIADLIDCKVVDESGAELGVLADVISTGANDVYAVRRKDGGEILIPAIKECILRVDISEKLVQVHLMEGLLDSTS